MKPTGAHPDKRLTAIQVRQLSKPGRYSDGNGLYLVVDPSGAKRWLLRTVVHGRRRDIGLGSVRLVSLAEARLSAQAMRGQARSGADPILERTKARRTVPTFEEAALAVHEEHKSSWRNDKHAKQWIDSLRRFAFPVLSQMAVNRIDTADVLKVLAPIWLTLPETARRVRQRIGVVLDWAEASGLRDGSNPILAVAKGLPKQQDRDRHHRALPFEKVPGFLKELRSDPPMTVELALEFLILTAGRTGEILGAKWTEVDLENDLWTVPADRMKAGRDHRVPLSNRAKTILEVMSARTSSPYIFEGHTAGRPLSNMALAMRLRRSGVEATPHGFRSSFRDWAAEQTNFPREIAEQALAHTLDSKVEAAYRRSDLLEKRRQMMDAWARFLLPARNG